jgi:uncharacterized pyridoxal phosphate-containing UPF0001 family protein
MNRVFKLKLKNYCSHFYNNNFLYKSEKGGIPPSELVQVYKHISETCTNLNVLGLMTIGSYEQSTNENEINIDFKVANISILMSEFFVYPKQIDKDNFYHRN